VIILCVDDSYSRYGRFSRLAADQGMIAVVGCGRNFIEFYLDNVRDQIVGICLDHDMPGLNGEEVAREYMSAFNIPVVITSMNLDGAQRIHQVLTEAGVLSVRMRPLSSDAGWEERALSWFDRRTV